MDWSDAYRTLADEQRRRLLLLLHERSPRQARDVVAAIADSMDADHQQVRRKLSVIHLPRLIDAGFVEYAPGTGEIDRGSTFDDLRPLLEVLQDALPAND